MHKRVNNETPIGHSGLTTVYTCREYIGGNEIKGPSWLRNHGPVVGREGLT